MKESIVGLLVGAITLFLTNIFSYLFAIKKEVRVQSTKYKTEMLDNVYTPIYKILIKSIIPGDGYECIDDTDLEAISKIAENHVNLVDPKLDKIIWSLKEEARYKWDQLRGESADFVYLDEDRNLLNHIISYHNKLRKSLGLPYEKEWIKNLINFRRITKGKYKKTRYLIKRLRKKI